MRHAASNAGTAVGSTIVTVRSRTQPRRPWSAALVAVAVVHFPYPLAFLWTFVAGQDAGHSDGSAALLLAPVMFAITAVVVGPLAWRAWHGRRLAPWALAAFLAFETWLWRNGTQTESWDEPGSAERLATFQLITHATALALLLGSTAAFEIGRRRSAPRTA